MSPLKKGFNEYRIEKDNVYIKIVRRDGLILESIIDLQDLEMVKNTGLCFHSKFNIYTNTYYAVATKHYKENGKDKQQVVYLHQIILDGCVSVDHINHDSMDNRRQNLRPSDKSSNAWNRNSANKNNKTGHRNISFIRGWYVVQLMKNGERKMWKFKTLEESIECAKEMRKKYFGEFAGNE